MNTNKENSVETSTLSANLVLVKIRKNYGKQVWYPANNTATTFCLLINKKTFSPMDIAAIKHLGFVVKTTGVDAVEL